MLEMFLLLFFLFGKQISQFLKQHVKCGTVEFEVFKSLKFLAFLTEIIYLYSDLYFQFQGMGHIFENIICF